MTPFDLDVLRQEGARNPDGTFAPGNLARLKHGLRVRPDHPELLAAHQERVDAIVADLGGMSQLSAVQIPLVRELARLQLVADALGNDVLAGGTLTSKGRVRACVTLWMSVVHSQQRLAERLGLERKARPVDDLRAWAQRKDGSQ